MAELRGGTTIGGYTAFHSGLKEAYLSGNLTMGGNIKLSSGGEIWSGYNNAHIIKDFSNGNVTLSAAGSQLYLGYQNTTGVRISANLYGSNGTTLIASTAGTLYYQGVDADTRWLTLATNPYISTDLSGTSTYPRLVVKNGGATDNNWIRVSGDSYGILPYSNGNSYLGTSSWNFKAVYATTLYEGNTALASKYSDINHNHDSTYVKLAGSTMTGALTANGGITLNSNITVGDSTERSIKGSALNSGLYINSTALGLYDWKNSRGIFTYNQSSYLTSIYGTNIVANIGSGGTFRVSGGNGASLAAGTGYLLIGSETSSNMIIDDDEIQSRNNGAASTLYLNRLGGSISMGGAINWPTQNMTIAQLAGQDFMVSLPENYGSGAIIGTNQSTHITAGDGAWTYARGIGNSEEAVYLSSDGGSYIATNTNTGTTSYIWRFGEGNLQSPQYSGAGGYLDPYFNIKNNSTVGNWNISGTPGTLFKVNWDGSGSVIWKGLLIDGISDTTGNDTNGLTLRDASNGRNIMDSNEQWVVDSAGTRISYTMHMSDLWLNRGGGSKRLARVSYGTAAPTTTNAYEGDIYVQY